MSSERDSGNPLAQPRRTEYVFCCGQGSPRSPRLGGRKGGSEVVIHAGGEGLDDEAGITEGCGRHAESDAEGGCVSPDDKDLGSEGALVPQPGGRQRSRWRYQQEHQSVRVVVHEILSEDFGLFTWPSAVVLACLVWAKRREFSGASVVEIGAGTALPGLLAAKLGARVVLTDREEAPWILDNMRGAVVANGLTQPQPHAIAVTSPFATVAFMPAPASRHARDMNECSVQGLSWGRITPAATELAEAHPRPQFILGADVFYSSEHFDDVLATVFLLLSASSSAAVPASGHGAVGKDAAGFRDDHPSNKCVFLTAYHERSSRRSIRPLLRKWGMVARVLQDAPREVLSDALWEDGRYDSVALLEISLAE